MAVKTWLPKWFFINSELADIWLRLWEVLVWGSIWPYIFKKLTILDQNCCDWRQKNRVNNWFRNCFNWTEVYPKCREGRAHRRYCRVTKLQRPKIRTTSNFSLISYFFAPRLLQSNFGLWWKKHWFLRKMWICKKRSLNGQIQRMTLVFYIKWT